MQTSRLVTCTLLIALSLVLSVSHATAYAPGQVFTVNSASDSVDDDGCTSSHCSLREAILLANGLAGPDTIVFAILSQSVPTIQVGETGLGPLPLIVDPVIIDGTTQGAGKIELNGAQAGDDAPGLLIEAGSTRIAGLVINRFDGYGIILDTFGGNVIEGNYIGTDITGLQAQGNHRGGILIRNSPGNRIGGVTAQARNIISANGEANANVAGITIIERLAANNLIQGNYIGTTFNGLDRLGNQGAGIRIHTSNNVVGGTVAGAGNVIAGNTLHGIHLLALDTLQNASENRIEGNRIGTNPAGTAAVGNNAVGIFNEGGRLNIIGGTEINARNLIAGNGSHGISVVGNQVTVLGNWIGTNAAGDAAIPNGGQGVQVADAVQVTVGGTVAGSRNIIAGNSQDGVGLLRSNNIAIQGNSIGVTQSGGALGNGGAGVDLFQSSGNQVGGTVVGAANIIAHNAQAGVVVRVSGATNAIRCNAIYANGGLGIDLGADGVTANDPLDPDIGINQFQNFPILTSAQASGGGSAFGGIIQTRPNQAYSIDLFSSASCDPSTFGEGETYLGTTAVLTNGDGFATFATTLAAVVPNGRAITATATDNLGNTSEFARCITMGEAFSLTSVVGRVDLQGRANDAGSRVEAAGMFVLTQTDGSFSMSLPPGTFTIRASHSRYLPAERQITVAASPIQLPTVLLLGGDANDSGSVSLADLTILGVNYGLAVPPGDARADINADELISLPDLVIIGANYGLSGVQPWP